MKDKVVYEVFKERGFTAVVVPGSKASKELWRQKLFTGDVRLNRPEFWGFMEKVGLVEKVRGK